MSNLDPDFLAMLEEENNVAKNSTPKTRRLKIENGHSYLFRYLPVQLGAQGSYWARIANHWINRRTYTCIKHTHPDFGGDPGAQCEICVVAERLNGSPNSAVSKAAYRCMNVPQWIMNGLLLEVDNGKGDGLVPVDNDERWLPYQMSQNKTGFTQWSTAWKRRYHATERPYSTLDLYSGCDYIIQGLRNGYNLQPEEAKSIFEGFDFTEQEQQDTIDYIWNQVQPIYAPILKPEEVNAVCQKVEEACREAAKQAQQQSTTISTATQRTGPPSRGVPGRPGPSAPQGRGPAAAPRTQAAPPRSAAPPRQQAPPRSAEPEQDPVQDDQDTVSFPTRQAAPPSSAPPARNGAPPSAAALSQRIRRATPPAAAAVPPPASRSNAQSSVDPNEDNVTDENNDPVPPTDGPAMMDGGGEQDPGQNEQDEPVSDDMPPPVTVPKGPPPGKLADRLRRGLSAAAPR